MQPQNSRVTHDLFLHLRGLDVHQEFAVSFNYDDYKPKICGTQSDKYEDIYGNKRANE